MSPKPWFLTRHGVEFDLSEPEPDMVDLRDLAFHLARKRRFSGGTVENCSVALHCVVASYICPPCYSRECFLHDAAETYIGDIVGPVKWMLGDQMRIIEDNILHAIYERFGLPKLGRGIAAVRRADLQCLKFERDNFMPPSKDWEILENVRYPKEADAWLGYYEMDEKQHERLYLDRATELGLR